MLTFIWPNLQENVRFVNPVSEAEFPGVLDIVQRLQSWDWVYGKTPRFSLHRVFSGPGLHSNDYCLKTDIDIEKGSVASVRLHLDDPSLAELVHAINIFYLQNAKDLKLVHHSLSHLKDKSFHYVHTVLNNKSPEVMFVAKWIIQCVDSCFRFLWYLLCCVGLFQVFVMHTVLCRFVSGTCHAYCVV